MTGKFAVAAVALGLSAGAWAQAQPHGAMNADSAQKAKKAPKPSAAPPALQPAVQAAPKQPVVPLRPDQMPPIAPQVNYQDGQLSIVAQNSTLSSILTAVRARTGAQVEMPADTVNDRVAVKLGPGNPRDVLASLLQGSRFDYIVLGSAVDPNVVSQIILTPHLGSGATQAAAASSQFGPPPGQPGGVMSGGQRQPPGVMRGGTSRPEINAAEEDEPATEVQPPSPPVPQPEPPVPGAVMQPGPAPQAAPGAEQAQPAIPEQQNPNQPKTPEQLLQELQRMQQQSQQPRRPPQ